MLNVQSNSLSIVTQCLTHRAYCNFGLERLYCISNDACYLRFSSQSRIFHSFGDVTITDEGLLILVYAWHSWPLSNEGSLVCHTYCDTGHPFMWSSPTTNNTHLLLNNWQWSCHYLFSNLSRPRIKPWSSSCEAKAVQNEPLRCLQWSNLLKFSPNFDTYTAHPFYKVIYKQFSR